MTPKYFLGFSLENGGVVRSFPRKQDSSKDEENNRFDYFNFGVYKI